MKITLTRIYITCSELVGLSVEYAVLHSYANGSVRFEVRMSYMSSLNIHTPSQLSRFTVVVQSSQQARIQSSCSLCLSTVLDFEAAQKIERED